MFCIKCGAEMADDAMFCEKCGNKVMEEDVVQVNNFAESGTVETVGTQKNKNKTASSDVRSLRKYMIGKLVSVAFMFLFAGLILTSKDFMNLLGTLVSIDESELTYVGEPRVVGDGDGNYYLRQIADFAGQEPYVGVICDINDLDEAYKKGDKVYVCKYIANYAEIYRSKSEAIDKAFISKIRGGKFTAFMFLLSIISYLAFSVIYSIKKGNFI